MGNRSLETYRQHQERSRSKSKSSPKDASSRASPRSSHREAGRRQSGSSSRAGQDGGNGGDSAVQVAALDERNLKRAVNRYGTMPKGARIGAYLESLRQSGMTPEPVTDQGVDSDATLDSSSQGGDTLERNGRPPQAHPHFQHSSLNKSRQPVSAAAAAQMLRSNSSHGGFGGGGAGGGGGGRGSPIQRATPNNQLRRALTSGIDTPMRGATATGAQHQLPGEEFLPPPPQGEGLGHFPAPPSHFLANRRPSPSPRAKRKDSANKENLPERLKSARNRASDEEGSDPDRSSLQSPAAVQAAAVAASAGSHPPPPAPNSHFATPKSPTSPVSECRTLGSPAVGSLSSPGSTMDDGRMAGARKNSSGSGPTDAIRPFSKAKLEQKLVDELKAKESSGGGAHQKQQSFDSAAPPSESGPASLLVCELAESIKSKGQRPKSPLLEKQTKAGDGDDVRKHEVDFKANLRKVKKPDSDEASHAKLESNPNPHEIDFKSNLKKTPKGATSSGSGKLQEKAGNEGDPARAAEEPNIVDFKAKLKKPKPMVPAEVANSGQAQQQQQPQQGDDQLNFKARLRKVSGDKPGFTVMEGEGKGASSKNGVGHAKDSPEAEEDKRKSTGSISSLRKMWESSDQKKGKAALPDSNPTSPTSETNSESRSVKFEKRVWPPVPSTETEKPMVPVKPTMKPAAPTSKPPPPTSKPPPPTTKPPAAKPHPLCNIYAAPTTQVRPKPPGAKPAIASKPPQSGAAAGAAASAASSAASATRSGSVGEASGDSGGGSSTATEKDSILSSSQTLESKLTAAKAKSSAQMSTSSLMQLSDSVGSFHSSCASFADNVTPTGRFRFRSLLSRLEEQKQSLRSGAHCIDDIHSTVKDLVTVIQR